MVRVHKHSEAVFFALLDHMRSVVCIFFVVLPTERSRSFSVISSSHKSKENSRSFMLYTLPRKQIPKRREAPFAQPSQMHVRFAILQPQHPAHKRDVARLCRLPKVVELRARLTDRRLCAACKVDASQEQGAASCVSKVAAGRVGVDVECRDGLACCRRHFWWSWHLPSSDMMQPRVSESQSQASREQKPAVTSQSSQTARSTNTEVVRRSAG